MRIVFFTFYYPPDLGAGSFRAVALAKSLAKKIDKNDDLHIITTHPNRYKEHRVESNNLETDGNVTIHRIQVPGHQSGMFSQIRTFGIYAVKSYKLSIELNPNYLIGSTSRLMTGILTGIVSYKLNRDYFIDLRDIFSETISDIFSSKSRISGFALKTVFSFIEKQLFNNALGVNVVSKGFPEYFQANKINTKGWSFFPNGVDKEFTNLLLEKTYKHTNIKKVLYVGNVGSGQGLEKILPIVAKHMGDAYLFQVVGDGGTMSLLRNSIIAKNVTNIEIHPPVARSKLIEYYRSADILFLHLNDLPAFRRVLPSKLFEYASLGKPIVAGLSGYSANFVIDNVPYAKLFSPGDVKECIRLIEDATYTILDENKVNFFVSKYSRECIMNNMAVHILSVFKNK